MLQYIINSSAIWLTGLIVFDVFLRREAQHSYNRFYLLGILFAGALIPLWTWDYDGVVYSTNISRPIAHNTSIAREVVVNATKESLLSLQDILSWIYISGVIVSITIISKELYNISRLYRDSKKSSESDYIIITTNKTHSPYSLFKYIFISSEITYQKSELEIILAHERAHGHLLHSVDLIMIRVIQAIFWFNPLVYALNKRLIMIHEYQADHIAANSKKEYQEFLIEQSVLGNAPRLTHSFFHSPLKKRILMLSQENRVLAKGKQVLIIPVLTISFLCCTENAPLRYEKPKIKGNIAKYNSHTIEYTKEETIDSTDVINSETQKPAIVITKRPPRPILLDGEKIYTKEELKTILNDGGRAWGPDVTYATLREYLLTNLDDDISLLKDGEYVINVHDIIIDKKGNIVFFKYGGVREMVKGKDGVKRGEDIDASINEQFAISVAKLLNNCPSHKAAWNGPDKVNCLITDIGESYQPFIVKKGELRSL